MKPFLVVLVLGILLGCGDMHPCPDFPCGNVPLSIQIDFGTRPAPARHSFRAVAQSHVFVANNIYDCDVDVTDENATTVGTCSQTGATVRIVTESDRATATMTVPEYPPTLDLSISTIDGPVASATLSPRYRKTPADNCGPECVHEANAVLAVE
jgi:hypothetical protein